MERVNILHLSDAHITSHRSVDQKIVLTALFKDLEQIRDSDLAPDYVVFSGDLVNNPDEPDAYNHLIGELLFPLLDATRVDLDNFIFVAGNHDVSRAACGRFPLELEALGAKLGNHEYFNELYAKNGFPELIMDKFASYTAFIQSLSASCASKADIFCSVWDYPSAQLTFVVLNSSLLSLASLSGVEQGRLCFPDVAANKAFIAVNPERLIISVQHHPLTWFQDGSASELQKTILNKSTLHLFGHLHEAVPHIISSPLGTTALIQAPSLFFSRNYLNGYSIISMAPDRSRIAATFLTYFETRRAFGIGENVAADGIFYPDGPSRNYWNNQPLRINLRKFRRWLTEHALIEKIDFYNETTVFRQLSEIFVFPPITRIDVKKTKDEHTPGDPFLYTKVSHEQLLDTETNLLIFCPPEHGQSSLAKTFALNHILRSATVKIPRLPLIVDCAHLRKYDASLMGLIKAQAPDLILLGKSLNVILEEGLALIIFENVNPVDREQRDIICSFINKFNKGQFVIFVRSEFSGSVDTLLDI
jgi:predicted MPP superfamily phosphohydrolase